MESKLLDIEASAFPVTDGVAMAAFKGRGIETIKVLAQKIIARPGVVVLLADESDQIRVVFARSADRTADMASLLKRALEQFGGRGGGRPHLAQAGGLTASTAQEILDWTKNVVAG
jgi:alanyl-tRNA synthetase